MAPLIDFKSPSKASKSKVLKPSAKRKAGSVGKKSAKKKGVKKGGFQPLEALHENSVENDENEARVGNAAGADSKRGSLSLLSLRTPTPRGKPEESKGKKAAVKELDSQSTSHPTASLSLFLFVAVILVILDASLL